MFRAVHRRPSDRIAWFINPLCSVRTSKHWPSNGRNVDTYNGIPWSIPISCYRSEPMSNPIKLQTTGNRHRPLRWCSGVLIATSWSRQRCMAMFDRRVLCRNCGLRYVITCYLCICLLQTTLKTFLSRSVCFKITTPRMNHFLRMLSTLLWLDVAVW